MAIELQGSQFNNFAAQGGNNFLQAIMQQVQLKQQGEDIQSYQAWQSNGMAGPAPMMKTPQGQQLMMKSILEGPMQAAKLDEMKAETKKIEASTPTPQEKDREDKLKQAQLDLEEKKVNQQPMGKVEVLTGEDGKPHRVLINPITGEQIKDLGEVAATPVKDTAAISLKRKALSEQLGREPTDAEVDSAIQKDKENLAETRGESYAKGRAEYNTVQVIDTKNNNQMKNITVKGMIDGNKSEPGRYLSATAQTSKALQQTAFIQDVQGAAQNTIKALDKLPDVMFSEKQAAQISLALSHAEQGGVLSSVFKSDVAKTLTPEQQDYIISLAQLQENAMAIRSILGAGQGSEDLRAAIWNTVPSAKTPSKDYAKKQISALLSQLDRIGGGIPDVPLKNSQGQQPQQQQFSPDEVEAELKRRGL
jgi:hypothetical protein